MNTKVTTAADAINAETAATAISSAVAQANAPVISAADLVDGTAESAGIKEVPVTSIVDTTAQATAQAKLLVSQPKGPTKSSLVYDMIAANLNIAKEDINKAKSRADMIREIMATHDMKHEGASTYYFNSVKKYKEANNNDVPQLPRAVRA